MASVRELKTKWQIRFCDAHRDPKRTTNSIPKAEYPTRTQAENEAEWRQQLYDRGKFDPWVQDHPDQAATSRIGMLDAVERYVEAKREAGRRGEAGGWGEKTYRSDAPILEDFAHHVGAQTLLENVQRGHVQRWVYEPHLADATKKGRWVRLRAMFRWMEERGWVDPPEMPGRPQVQGKVRVTLTPSQLEKVCTAYDVYCELKVKQNKHTTTAGVEWHKDAWRLTYYQGFRRSELLNLRVRNVMLEDDLIQVGDRDYQQKGRRQSLIPLVEPAREILEPYLADRDRDERVFGTPATNDKVSRFWRRTVDFAADPSSEEDLDVTASDVPFDPLDEDPEEVDFYTLRHSCCTYWLRERRRLIWVNHLMRHKDIDTTMEYIHLLPTDLREMYQNGRKMA